jgi:methionyl-tRNA synthetase
MADNKFYVTTPIFYTNGEPHLGHVFAMTIADMFARYYRLRGEETFFLTGTDDNGSTVAQTAKEKGITPKEWSDKNATAFRKAAEEFNISYSDFIRTSDSKKHWPTAQEMWRKLEASGDLYKRTYKGLYCVGHEAFVTEKDLDEKGLCPDHGTEPEVVEEQNYFFKLSKYGSEM